MHRFPFEQQLLIVLQFAATTGLCVRLWWTGLYRVYVYFFVYLLLVIAQSVILSSVPFHSPAYRDCFLVTEGLIACSYSLIVLELYSIVLRDLGGIASVSRRYIKIILGVAIASSALLLVFERTPRATVARFIVFERVTVSSLVIFVILISGFLLYYPIHLNRNVIVYSIGYAFYFLIKAAALFVDNVDEHWVRQFDTLRIGASTVCLLFWMFMLSRQGEKRTLRLGHHWKPEDEERVLSRLQDINASLLRAGRK
jgi:hypothetical protein